jgi:protein CpxP
MKKVFLAGLMLIGLTTFAQEKETRKGDREKLTKEQKVDLQVKRMSTDLDLNEKQTKDVRVFVTKEVEKREAKREEMMQQKEQKQQRRAELKAQMEKEQEATSAEMKKILTPEQFAKWEKIREERKANVKGKMLERKAGKMGKRSDNKLNPEEKQK